MDDPTSFITEEDKLLGDDDSTSSELEECNLRTSKIAAGKNNHNSFNTSTLSQAGEQISATQQELEEHMSAVADYQVQQRCREMEERIWERFASKIGDILNVAIPKAIAQATLSVQSPFQVTGTPVSDNHAIQEAPSSISHNMEIEPDVPTLIPPSGLVKSTIPIHPPSDVPRVQFASPVAQTVPSTVPAPVTQMFPTQENPVPAVIRNQFCTRCQVQGHDRRSCPNKTCPACLKRPVDAAHIAECAREHRARVLADRTTNRERHDEQRRTGRAATRGRGTSTTAGTVYRSQPANNVGQNRGRGGCSRRSRRGGSLQAQIAKLEALLRQNQLSK